MQKLQWRTEVREVRKLLTWTENPRTITKVALEKLKDKITQSGFHSVIVIDTDNTILSGNQNIRMNWKLYKHKCAIYCRFYV